MTRRSALTLFQLLVALAVLAMLLAFLLPAVQKVREAAARTQSSNNLKQLGLGVHNYHDTHNGLPPGNDKNNFSTHTYLLPYIEQDNLYKTIDLTKASDDKDNAVPRNTFVKVFISPLDPQMRVLDAAAPTNYVFSAGSKPELANNNGIFYQESKTKFQNVTDGLSNTLMTAETLKGDNGTKPITVKRQHVQLKAADLKDIKDSAGEDDWKNAKNIAGTRCASWMDGRFLQGTFTATRGINDDRPDVDCGGAGGLSGPRLLRDYTIVLLGDGSVRVVNKSVAFATWQNLAHAADGNVIGDF